jgi:short subunit dehydrogenase-like uncharacterized protein
VSAQSPGETPARIVVLGATGFTGRLLAHALVARGLQPVLAGRSAPKLQALAQQLGGVETALANTSDPKSVRRLVSNGEVLATTVGPFARHGRTALDAAIAGGAHYVDSTGESGFIRTVFADAGPRAAASGSALLTAFGYDFVPGNLAAALALRQAGSAATRVVTGYFLDGEARPSSGTAATMLTGLTDPSHLLRGGRLVLLPTGRKVHSFADRGVRRPGVLLGSTESLSLPRTFPQLTEVANYLGWLGKRSYALPVASFATGLLQLPPLRRSLKRRADRAAAITGQGPDEVSRRTQRSVAIAVASDASGKQLTSVRVEGPNGYDLTAQLMAWAASELAHGRVKSVGALGPVDAFGLDRLVEGCRSAGLVVSP